MSTSGSHYKAIPVAANATVIIRGSRVGGFVCTTAGSFQFILRKENLPDVTLPAIPLTAGQSIDIPFFAGTTERSTLVASGGGAGILFAA